MFESQDFQHYFLNVLNKFSESMCVQTWSRPPFCGGESWWVQDKLLCGWVIGCGSFKTSDMCACKLHQTSINSLLKISVKILNFVTEIIERSIIFCEFLYHAPAQFVHRSQVSYSSWHPPTSVSFALGWSGLLLWLWTCHPAAVARVAFHWGRTDCKEK